MSTLIERLEDCPFCGSRPKVKYIGNDRSKSRKIQVKCSNRSCRVSRTDAALTQGFEWLEGHAQDGWNKRQAQRIKELTEALQHYGKNAAWSTTVIDSYSGEVTLFDWDGDLADEPWEFAERALQEPPK